MELNTETANLLKILKEKKLTLSTAESCTGGNIAHYITLIPGSSEVYMGGVVSYSNEAKQDLLGVSSTNLEQFGAVSEAVVIDMVNGACRAFHTDCAIATSGIAGPGGGTPEKPVGTVWTAIQTPRGIFTECLHISGNRPSIIEATTLHTLRKLAKLLCDHGMLCD